MKTFKLNRLVLIFLIMQVSSCDLPVVGSIIDRFESDDITRSESRSLKLDNFEKNIQTLPYLIINNEKKKVPNFQFINQNG